MATLLALLGAVPPTIDLSGSVGLEFDHRDRTLLTAAAGVLYRFDPATGTTTLLAAVSGVSFS